MTQSERILEHMREKGSITQLTAMQEYGIYRLASRISDLRKEGVNIKREMVKGKNRYGEKVAFASYSLGDENETL